MGSVVAGKNPRNYCLSGKGRWQKGTIGNLLAQVEEI
jgi:hypothetical protein